MNDRTTPSAAAEIRGILLLPQADGTVREELGTVHFADGRILATTTDTTGADDGAPQRLVLPGLVDLHIHWPQGHVRGAFAGQLLPWLRESIWPAEAEFSDVQHAAERADTFMTDLLRAGTCGALLFGPPFLSATRALLKRAPLGFFDGPAIMEVNAPANVTTPASQVLAEIEALPEDERARVAVSPRFAPNLTAAGLMACGQTATRLGLPLQSHISENLDEVAWVRELFAGATSYTDVYARAGMLGPHCVLAHGVHLSDEELRLLADTGTIIAHCPSSNEALTSGRMPIERLQAAGVRWVLATDVGAGPKLSQLDTMRVFLAVHEAARVPVLATEALVRASVVPGAVLAEFDSELTGLGTLAMGAPGHALVFDLPAGCTANDGAETLLRGLLSADRDALETLPTEVWLWGERVV